MNTSLASLKDIHLPTPESWWYLAWGWWLLLGLLMLLAVGLWLALPLLKAWHKKRQMRRALKQDIQRELLAMRSAYEKEHDGLVLLTAISTFLRRVSISVFAREQSAGLIQHEWLAFLDQQWGDKPAQGRFSDEINANLLQYGAYQQEIDENMQLNIEKLLDLSEKWASKVVKYHV